MHELELKEKKIKEIQGTGDRLLREDHPARPTVEVGWGCGDPPRASLVWWGRAGGFPPSPCAGQGPTGPRAVLQSFQAALQTQWSWMLQLCCCIEAHLKDNTAYFQVRTGLPNPRLCYSDLEEPLGHRCGSGAPPRVRADVDNRPHALSHGPRIRILPGCWVQPLRPVLGQLWPGAFGCWPSVTHFCRRSSSRTCGRLRSSCGNCRRRCAGSTPVTVLSPSLGSRTCCRTPR